MTRVALITNGIVSTLYTGIELARRLEAAGHEVTVISHADVGDVVQAAGLDMVRLSADRDAYAELRILLGLIRGGTARQRVASIVRLPLAVVRRRRATVRADELIAVLDRLDPGLLVIDIEEHVAILASARLGVPTALTTFLFAIEERPGVPPIDSWCDPDDDRLPAEWERIRRNERAARRRRGRSLRALLDLLGPVSYRTTSRLALRAVARHSGFDLRWRTDPGQWLRPHGYTDLPVLTTNLRELEFGDGAAPNWEYVGPMVGTSRPTTDHVVSEWEQLRHGREAAERNGVTRPLVYCTLGSYWNADMGLLGEVVDVARLRPEWDVVIGLGGAGDRSALGSLPVNVLALGWAPQVEILDDADVAIVHGGNASLNECIVTGVPMVVCSTGHLDQNGIAARVGHAGLGVGLVGATATAAEIEAAVERCLSDPAIRSAVDAMRSTARRQDVRDRAVRSLERLIEI